MGSTMDTVEISDGGDEPTMEDILSSIRKIIADDKISEEAEVTVDGTAEDDGQSGDSLELETDEDVVDIEDILQIPALADTDTETETETETESADFSSSDVIAEEPDDGGENKPELVSEPADETDDILELMESIEESDEEPELALETIIDDDEQFEAVTQDMDEVDLDVMVLEEAADELAPSAESVPDTFDSEQLVVENTVGADEIEIIDEPIADLALGFDESLDLVMEADASDYLTPADEKPNDATDWKDKIKSGAAPFGAHAVISEHDKEDILQVSADESAPDEAVYDEVAQHEAALEIEQPDEIDAETTETTETTETDETDETSGKPDEDLDLVKSLLADLMDEEHPNEGEPATDFLPEADADRKEPSAPETILDEILDVSIDDEISLQETKEQETEIGDTAQEPKADDRGESELSRIAREAREAAAQEPSAEIIENDADVITLPAQDASKDFALLAGAAAAAGVGMAALSSDDEEKMADLVSEFDPEPETEIEIPEPETEINEESQLDPLPADTAIAELTDQPQEENPMVRIVKTETLLGDDTEKDTTDAFASLSDVVQEKAELAENGPAIGELVQEALKPMLQEWLDKNLKGIVTRAVTKEIKRISSTK